MNNTLSGEGDAVPQRQQRLSASNLIRLGTAAILSSLIVSALAISLVGAFFGVALVGSADGSSYGLFYLLGWFLPASLAASVSVVLAAGFSKIRTLRMSLLASGVAFASSLITLAVFWVLYGESLDVVGMLVPFVGGAIALVGSLVWALAGPLLALIVRGWIDNDH